MGRSLPQPGLRPFLPADLPVLAEIFRASVEELTAEDYTAAQRDAWAARADEEAFAQRLSNALTLVATMDGSPLGFIALKDNTHIDFLFVHPAVAGQGIGSMLYDAVEKLATARAVSRLTADVSDTALAFFQKRGFQPQRRNTVTVGDQWLANTTMDKPLGPGSEGRVAS